MKTDRREFIKTCFYSTAGCLCLASSVKAGDKKEDSFKHIAYCGADCTYCDAYKATINNNDDLRKKVAKRWKMKPEQINCRGCKSGKSPFDCEAKKCAIERGESICALCDDFPDCPKDIWMKYPSIRRNAQELRDSLKTTTK